MSIRQRLLNLSVHRGEDPNLTLTRYALERLLYRLACSEYEGGSSSSRAPCCSPCGWSPRTGRRADLDLLGFGEASSERLHTVFQRLCAQHVEPGGLVFDARTIHVTPIREGQAYPGQRVKLAALLGTARIPVQIDVGFGDAVTPQAMEIDYPTLLDLPAPRLRAYPPETVVAEKLEALVTLGMQNSRLRDFYDLWIIARQFSFEGPTLVAAVGATFKRRRTDIPNTVPTRLSEEFATDEHKRTQWKAFLTCSQLAQAKIELSSVIDALRIFLMPVLDAAANDRSFDHSWVNGGPWAAKQ
ncbi:MAG: nucleotidyl transferase AbiEii/AbiGii toxin family protein [Acidiferrobacteraceae bacterium]